mmetsp:Transcript_15776/g.52792  ORF Transcript_15776/g.52792 Transcript_15776/m.52792 type:complete len:404 (-) Transcript_15776:1587-2798(-)
MALIQKLLLGTLLCGGFLPADSTIQHLHQSSRRLRGCLAMVDIKWTPGSDEPIAPFSKRAREAQGKTTEAGDSRRSVGVMGIVAGIGGAIWRNPKEASYVLSAGAAGYMAYSLRKKVQGGWPVIIQSQYPTMTFLRPNAKYMKNEFLPTLTNLPINHELSGLTMKSQVPPGFSCFKKKMKVGHGYDDFVESCHAVKSLRVLDTVDWLGAHLATQQALVPEKIQRDNLAITIKTRLGYAVLPWRMSHCDPLPRAEAQDQSNATSTASDASNKGETLTWSMGCSTLMGNNFEGELKFEVTMEDEKADRDGDVWIEILAITRRAKGASIFSHRNWRKVLQRAMEEMLKNIKPLLETQKEMRAIRSRRQLEANKECREEWAAKVAKQVQRQQDLQDFKPKEVRRHYH